MQDPSFSSQLGVQHMRVVPLLLPFCFRFPSSPRGLQLLLFQEACSFLPACAAWLICSLPSSQQKAKALS